MIKNSESETVLTEKEAIELIQKADPLVLWHTHFRFTPAEFLEDIGDDDWQKILRDLTDDIPKRWGNFSGHDCDRAIFRKYAPYTPDILNAIYYKLAEAVYSVRC